MENLRRVVQVLVFVGFLYLFLATVGVYSAKARHIVLGSGAPVDLFFQLDPLLGLTTMLSTRQIIREMLVCGLPIVVLTLLAGRFFCGWLCPLGTCLDAGDKLFFRKRRDKRGESREGNARNIKYYVLVAVLVAAFFSSQLAYLLDPITIITRAFTLAAFPIVQFGVHSAGGQSPVFPADVQYFFRLNFLAAAVFVTIIALNSVSRRYWCRNLCPLGALLGVFSKVSLIRRKVSDRCPSCAKCIPDCKMGAIKDDPKQYQATECVYCYSCTCVCPALATKIVPSLASEGYNSGLDLNRRRLFQAAGIGAGLAVLGKTNAAAKTSRTGKLKISSAELIRPPGSVAEDEFVNRCVRCSECMKVCPTGGLQPALTEAGIEGLWTPVLVPRIGECSQQCNLCSQVCSTDAIQSFDLPEKYHLYIGRAVIDRSQCIAWNSDKQCLVCDEACSYHALSWKMVDGVKRPFINEHKCVGCGICENVCPIQPVAAVRVFSLGDKRHMTREMQKAFFEQAGKQQENAE
jgi:polyferredoxin/formate hydrogenlyase subunit 6/NADH:ubiquinone oxidoreductase subunit I